jgi:membrane protein implicated in regulation of membrane protease activity
MVNLLLVALVVIILVLLFGGGILLKLINFALGIIVFLVLLVIAVWLLHRLSPNTKV